MANVETGSTFLLDDLAFLLPEPSALARQLRCRTGIIQMNEQAEFSTRFWFLSMLQTYKYLLDYLTVP